MSFPRNNAMGVDYYPLPVVNIPPLGRLTSHWWNAQRGHCADYELDWAQCAGRVGYLKSQDVCKKYMDDFLECAWRIKTIRRYEIMQNERKRQQKPYLEKPPPDSHKTVLNLDHGMEP